MFLKKLKLLFFFSYIISVGYSYNSQVESIQIESKTNGIIIILNLDTLPVLGNCTAWQAKSGWFYITLYEVNGDSTNLSDIQLPNDISKFQIIEGDESLQLGLRLNKPIENYNFESSSTNNTLIAFLHYSTDYIAKLDSLKTNKKIKINEGTPNGIKTWINITGFGITLSGLIMDQNMSMNNTTKTGLMILCTNYIIDKILKII